MSNVLHSKINQYNSHSAKQESQSDTKNKNGQIIQSIAAALLA